MLFTRREVRIGKNCARGLGYHRTVFPNTDRPWLVNNIFTFFLKPNKWLRKEPPAVSGPDGENTARSRNQSDCRICRIPPAHELRKKIIVYSATNATHLHFHFPKVLHVYNLIFWRKPASLGYALFRVLREHLF